MHSGAVSPGTWWMIAAAFGFAVMAASAKMMPDLSSYEKVFGRSVLSVWITWWMMRRAGGSFRPDRKVFLLLRAVFGLAGLVCYFEAIERIPLGTAVTVYNLTPIFAALIGFTLLGERLTGKRFLSILIGLGGVAIIKGFTPTVTWGGVWFALGTAFFSAIAYSFVRILNRTEHPLTIVMAFPLVSLPLSLIAGGADFRWPVGMEWFWLVVLGVGTQMGQVCLTHALRYHTASRATQIGFIGVVFAMLLGAMMGDGLPGWAQVGGAVLVFWSLGLGKARAATAPSAEPAPRS
ncbi:MAG: DMT family transporter [Planctomycetota bacterium]|jgi:drug/metabolite transporter (DMT)-like permease